MTLMLIVVACLGIGAGIRRWWTVALPVLAGGLGAVLLMASGRGLADTPIPFLVVMATGATAAGVLLRRSRWDAVHSRQ